MELVKVREIVKRYLQGQSSLNEEEALKRWFENQNVNHLPEDLKPYWTLFQVYKRNKTKQFNSTVSFTKKTYRNVFRQVAVIAIVFAVGGSLFLYNYQNKKEITHQVYVHQDPDKALEFAVESLEKVSIQLNKGAYSACYISYYDKVKNRIFN